ncbi:MAG: PblA [Firmicutes bacterium]|nr:PblA [Bacillota bacterium]
MAESGTTIGRAFVQIEPSAKGIKGKLASIIGGESADAGKQAGASILSGIKKVLAGAAIGTILKQAIGEGAKLEQSIGGIETLFGAGGKTLEEYAASVHKTTEEASAEFEALMAAQTKALDNANNAYKTAGLSSNEYMETVTGMAAALKSSGLSEMEAAEAANKAIIAMADNANKMGTDMGAIQNAYAGFAKQNYTMLDNLKLGYGGTKTEMQRLLKDAEKLTGIHYDINNLSDVYDAIQAIQDNLGITGTTAKEASETISGSFAAMKSAFTNVLGGLALGQDIQPALQALVESTSVFLFDNLIPAVGNVIMALPGAIGTLIATGLPMFMQNGLEMIQGISFGLQTGIPEILAQALPTILAFTGELRNNIGLIVDAGINLIINLVQGLINAMPSLISYVPQIISNIVNVINDNMPKILKAGWDIILMLAKGIIDNIPVIVENAGNIVTAIWDTISAVNWLDLGSNIIKGISGGVKKAASWLIDSVKEAASAALNGVKNFLGIHSPSTVFRDKVGAMMAAGIIQGFEDNLAVDEMIGPIKSAVSDISESLVFGADTYIPRTDYNVSEKAASSTGYTQILNVYAPQELSAAEVARQSKLANQNMILSLNGI